MGAARHLPSVGGRPAPEILRSGNVPLSLRAHSYGACAELHHGRRRGPLYARQRPQRAASDGLGRLRPAGRERGHRARRASRQMDLRQHRRHARPAQEHGPVARLVARARHLRPRLLPPAAAAVPRHAQGRPGRPQDAEGQLGPGRPDGARQRAGDRRARLALRRRWSSSASSRNGCSRSPTMRKTCSRRWKASSAGRRRSG